MSYFAAPREASVFRKHARRTLGWWIPRGAVDPGAHTSAMRATPQSPIIDGLAVTYAIVNIATAYCPNLAADSEYMQRIDEWKKAINPDEGHFLADIGRHAVNLRRKMGELGEAEWCADALIAFGAPPGEGMESD